MIFSLFSFGYCCKDGSDDFQGICMLSLKLEDLGGTRQGSESQGGCRFLILIVSLRKDFQLCPTFLLLNEVGYERIA